MLEQETASYLFLLCSVKQNIVHILYRAEGLHAKYTRLHHEFLFLTEKKSQQDPEYWLIIHANMFGVD